MTELGTLLPGTYLALRGDFMLKPDGGRAILYPLDVNDPRVTVLRPFEGLVLSLVSGKRTLAELRSLYAALFPAGDGDNLTAVLESIDSMVKKNRTGSGVGKDGVFVHSSSPMEDLHHLDPRDFAIDPARFGESQSSFKTRIRLETPISLLCVFTWRCTTNCAYCYAERRNTEEMSLGWWRSLLSQARELGIRMCSPDNGDVLARSDGVDLLEALLENDFLFLLSTKSLVTADAVRRLVEAGFCQKVNGVVPRTVQLSVDAVDADIQRRIYGVPSICQRTAQSFENFTRFGLAPRIKMVVTGVNCGEAKALVDYFYPLGARQFHFIRYSRSFFRHHDGLFLTADQVGCFRRQYEEIQAQYPDAACWQDVLARNGSGPVDAEDRRRIWMNRKGCGGGWLSLGVNADGRAFLCEQTRMNGDFIVGDLRTQSIREVWSGQKMLDFIYPPRNQFAGTICYECEDFEQCMWEKGRCYRDAYFAYGTVYDSPPMCPKNDRPGLRLT